jgi:hypothetical protein
MPDGSGDHAHGAVDHPSRERDPRQAEDPGQHVSFHERVEEHGQEQGCVRAGMHEADGECHRHGPYSSERMPAHLVHQPWRQADAADDRRRGWPGTCQAASDVIA